MSCAIRGYETARASYISMEQGRYALHATRYGKDFKFLRLICLLHPSSALSSGRRAPLLSQLHFFFLQLLHLQRHHVWISRQPSLRMDGHSSLGIATVSIGCRMDDTGHIL